MAEKRGGYRPTAPQNNPANISPNGGNGQSGQPKPPYSGFGYGKNKDLSMQSGGAAMLGTPSAPSSPAISLGAGGDQGASRAPQGQPSSLLGLGALHEMQPTGKHASDGTDFGRGEGSNALPNSVNPDRRPIENSALIGKYLPDLINAARIEGAPDSYKRFVNKLKGMI